MISRLAVIIGTILGIGLALLYSSGLDKHGYWEDEIYTARDIGLRSSIDEQPAFRLSFSELTYRNDNHPPFYFWLLEKWVRWFGYSEKSGRGFSVFFFALGAMVLVAHTSRWKDRQSSVVVWALLVFGICSYSFSMTREARMYSLGFFFVAASLVLFLEAWSWAREEGDLRSWWLGALLVAAGTLGLYTHYYVLFFYAGQLCLGGWLFLRQRAWRLLGTLLIPALLFLPWIPLLLQQRERKYESALWVLGPGDERSYFSLLVEEGSHALSRLMLGSTFEFRTVFLAFGIAALVYAVLVSRRVITPGPVAVLALLVVLPYGLLAANDLFHHTITLARPKYLFFLLPPLLLLFLRVALSNLAPIRFCLLTLFLTYNLAAIGREHSVQARPDWRATSARAEQVIDGLPLVVRDDDYYLCLRYYYHDGEVITEEWLTAYPEDFWLLVVYAQWKPELMEHIEQLKAVYDEVDRVDVDRFSTLIHLRLKPDPVST
jgi:hypothetical protein